MIKANIKNTLSFPRIIHKDDLKFIANRIVIPIMQENIQNSVALDESALPELEPETLKAKARKRQPLKPLIAEGKLRSGFLVVDHGEYGVKVKIHPEREKIGKYLQIDGVQSKRGIKHFNFFGISTRMEQLSLAYIKKRIGEIVKNARRK